jgi:E3 ubiquitin-protein ligase MARCH5
MQILDQKDAFKVMDQADPLVMLIALPSIPIMLVLCRFIKWEEFLLKLWRKYSNKLPVLNLLIQNCK